MNKKTVPIKEPQGKIWFSTFSSLVDHVIRHVLENRNERWDQLFDPEVLANARNEDTAYESFHPNFDEIRRKYFKILVESLVGLCNNQTGHRHLYWEQPRLFDEKEPEPNFLPDNAIQSIEVWDILHKIIIIAKSVVRNGEFQPYSISSGFRPYPKLSGNSLKTRCIQYLRDRKSTQKGIELAFHDEPLKGDK